jgi:imidazolonepropionase-like amidohydrolase
LEHSRKVIAAQREHFERALAAGVKIGAGTDRTGLYGPDPFADLAHELEVMHELGLSPMQAIQSATGVAAEIMGWEDRVGTIRPGLLADILVVEGNPLQDLGTLKNATMVIKGGQIAVDNLV